MVTLTTADTESVEMSVSEEPAPSFNAGLTTVVTENNYNDLRNKPSIEGEELTGNKTLNDLHGYTQTQIDAKLSAKADKSEMPSLDEYATRQWVTDKHYLTMHQSLAGYATENWVEGKHYLTSHQSLSEYYTKTQTDELLDDKADASAIPTKVSELTNDAGYIKGYTETDPTVPAWAKAQTKPAYTASEVGALPSTTKIPSKTSDLTNDSGFITLADLPVYNGGVR